MRFLVDAQLPVALARWLTDRGLHAEHVGDTGLRAADDGTIWRKAMATGAVLVTKDEDFALRSAQVVHAPQIVWIRIGNCRRAELLRRLNLAWPAIERAVSVGDRLVEVR